MQIHEKIRILRQFKGLTQEELAEQLHLAPKSYGKVERGETNLKVDKLQKIATILGIELQDLLDLTEKTVMNFAENCHHSHNVQHGGTIVLTETQCAHELEKSQLIIAQKDEKIGWLQKEIARLEEIIGLLRERKVV